MKLDYGTLIEIIVEVRQGVIARGYKPKALCLGPDEIDSLHHGSEQWMTTRICSKPDRCSEPDRLMGLPIKPVADGIYLVTDEI